MIVGRYSEPKRLVWPYGLATGPPKRSGTETVREVPEFSNPERRALLEIAWLKVPLFRQSYFYRFNASGNCLKTAEHGHFRVSVGVQETSFSHHFPYLAL